MNTLTERETIMVTRLITKRDEENARRLRNLWDARKKNLGLTQTKAAEALGLKHQSTVSQYLNCDIGMNTEILLKFAQLLEADPAQIDPQIRRLIPESVSATKQQIPVSCRIDLVGERGMAVAAKNDSISNPFQGKEPPQTELKTIEVGTNAYLYPFGFPHNANVMVLMDGKPSINDVVYVRQSDDTAGFYRFSGLQGEELLITDPLTSRNLKVNSSDITEAGVCVGWLANDMEFKEPWRV